MDFVGGGSVCDILEACEVTLSEGEARECAAWTVLALDYLHSNRKLHRVSCGLNSVAIFWIELIDSHLFDNISLHLAESVLRIVSSILSIVKRPGCNSIADTPLVCPP